MNFTFLASTVLSSFLPQTGEQTDWLPYIVGAGLITLAGILIILRLRKRKDDGHDNDLDR